MTNSTITGTITDPLATPLQYIKVTCRLYPRPAYVTATGVELTLSTSTLTDASGVYSFALRNTADITPADSYYVITEFIPDKYGGPVKHIIQAAGDNTVYASLVSPVPAPDQNVYLTQAAGDARYVQSPGSFGASGSISSIEPDDAVSAGVASTYARSDHQHAIVAAAPSVLTTTLVSSEGVGTGFAREDHVHGSAALPWGKIGLVTKTTDVTFSTMTDLSGLSLTWTAVANRQYRVTAFAYRVANGTTANQHVWVHVRESTTTLGTWEINEGLTSAAGGGQGCNLQFLISPSAGSHTYKISGERITGADTHTFYGSSTLPSYLLVEDIGPA